ncbi:MAG: hypothetical protein AB7T37_11285 [Dehalococcoidia bacterium]
MTELRATDQAWADDFVDPYQEINWSLRWHHEEFADRLRAFDVDAVQLMPKEWEQFLWTLSGYAGGTVWDARERLDLRLDVLRSVARLAKEIGPLTRQNGSGVEWLWKEIVGFRERHQPEINDAIARHLADQLLGRDRRLQMSALLGLLELDHPATPETVRAAIPTLADDPEIRELATSLAKPQPQ